MGKFVDLTGQRFGRLTVVERVYSKKGRHTNWLCKCDCGNKTITTKQHLTSNHTKSCGCLKLETLNKNRFKHGLCESRLYYIHSSMKDRCYNKNNKRYKNYGIRGIKVCDEWLNKENGFMNFYNWAMENGYRDDLTIDRIDVNGNYEPNNCRWATIMQQSNNKSNNHYFIYKNERHTISEWSKLLNIKKEILYDRINNSKIPLDNIFTKPIGRNRKIIQYDLDGNFIKEYNSLSEAIKQIGNTSIYACCRGKIKTAGGYVWRYADEVKN